MASSCCSRSHENPQQLSPPAPVNTKAPCLEPIQMRPPPRVNAVPFNPDDPDPDEEYIDPEVWKKYVKQVNESEGFDIKDYPGHCWMASHVPINFQRSSFETELISNLAILALNEYNNSLLRTRYVFEKLVTANSSVCAGIMYYITFEAREKKRRRDPVVKTFQAKVWDGIGHKTVKFCRLKKEQKASSEEDQN